MIWSTRSPSETITGAAVGVAAVVDPPPARLLAEGRVGLVDEAAHVDLLVEHGEPMGVELGQVEHVADEPLEPLRLGGDHLERLGARLRVLDQPFPQRIDVAADRRQRRPQLVRDRHQEVPLLLLGLGEPRRHLAEAVREVADLAAARHLGTSTS